MLLVLMSIEKCFAIYFPLKSKTICTVKKAKWATGIVGVVLAISDSAYFFVAKSIILKSSGRHTCVYTGNYRVIADTIGSILYSFGPFTLLFITNFAICLKLMTAKCNQNNSSQSTNQALAKSATRGTVMVVTVSVTFLILTAPTAVYAAVIHHFRLDDVPFYRDFMNLTQCLNHSINGVLYCFVGSKFRVELVKLFNRKRKRQSSPNVYLIMSI